MSLTDFLRGLLEAGKVTVAGQLFSFSQEDLRASMALLRQHYDEDTPEMHFTAPEFLPEAALWAARYLYTTIQLTVLRDLDEVAIKQHLTNFPGPVTPAAVYSADLTFRYLPDLLSLAKGLAPGDLLVSHLRETLRQWPFSSVGTVMTDAVDPRMLLGHPSLRQAYVDRIVQHRDVQRLSDEAVRAQVEAALGDYASTLWPDFPTVINHHP